MFECLKSRLAFGLLIIYNQLKGLIGLCISIISLVDKNETHIWIIIFAFH